MAEKVLVGAELTPQMIDAGKALTELLDAESFDVRAALWLFLSDTREWRLVFASPEVAKAGPIAFYHKLQSVLPKLTAWRISLSNITALPDTADSIQLFASFINTGQQGTSGMRMTNNIVNGVLIDDAYIYRVAPTRSTGKARVAKPR